MSETAIMVRLPNWVGDGALAAPAVRALQAARPDASLILVGTDRSAPLYGRWPRVSLLTVRRRSNRDVWQLSRMLRAASVESAVHLTPSFRSVLPSVLAGVQRRVGTPTDGRRLLLTDPVETEGRSIHLAKQYIYLAAALGADRDTEIDPSLPVGADETEVAARRLAGFGFAADRTIALCPGATYGATKRWPHTYWVALGESLVGSGHSIVVLGGADEREGAERLAEEIGESAKSLAGCLSLRQSLAMLRLLAAAVSNDSGLMHLAAAASCPVLGIFGSTNPRWTGPLGLHSKSVSLHLPCSPCFKKECPTEIECLRDLTPLMVLEALEGLVGSGGDRS